MLRRSTPLDEAGEAAVAETIDCGFTVHRIVGPGYLEPVYRHAMCAELSARGVPFESERVFTVRYRDKTVGLHRLDLVVRGFVVVELKAVRALEPIHVAQLMAYLKASQLKIGLLMNFGCATFKEGVKRVVL